MVKEKKKKSKQKKKWKNEKFDGKDWMLFPWMILPGQQNLEGMQNWSNLLLNLILTSLNTRNESHVIADWIGRKEVGKQLYLHTHSLYWSDSCQDCHLCPRSCHVLQHASAGQQEQQGEQGGCNAHTRSHSLLPWAGDGWVECTGKMRLRDALPGLSEHRDRQMSIPSLSTHAALCYPFLKPGIHSTGQGSG